LDRCRRTQFESRTPNADPLIMTNLSGATWSSVTSASTPPRSLSMVV
jgi:hypothetical protein